MVELQIEDLSIVWQHWNFLQESSFLHNISGADILFLRRETVTSTPDLPKGWGDDSITDFFEKARKSNFATFSRMTGPFKRLIDIDAIFRSAIDYMSNSRSYFALLFFLKAHSSFLGAVHLACDTQIPDAYMVLRGVLESSLYGFYIHKKPKVGQIWLKRHESEKDKRKVKNTFKISEMMRLLEETDSKLGTTVGTLYERSINYGAHPNERSLAAMLKIKKGANSIKFKLAYLTDDQNLIRSCLRSSAQTGVASLKILELIIPERFQITGLSQKLESVSKGI